MGRLNDLTGREFERLKVLRFICMNKHRQAIWECQCSCGKVLEIASYSLITKNTRSCGCLHIDTITTHGYARSSIGQSLEYVCYQNMLQRCCKENNHDYDNYGGRGIYVCEEWKNSFERFLADMGNIPTTKHSLERKDNNGPYSPENCCWATKKEQCRNKRTNHLLTLNNETYCVTEWAERLGIKPTILFSRLGLGWSVERTLTTPVRSRR